MKDRDVDLTPTRVEDTRDVVRMYLREAGRVSLLTRCAEVEVAKRIERGQLNTLKALSRSAMVTREMSGLRQDLAAGKRSIQEIVIPNEQEWTDDGVTRRKCEVIAVVGEIERLNRQLIRLKAKNGRNATRRHCRSWVIARRWVRISRLIRSIGFTQAERLRLIEKVRQTVEELNSLELEVSRLETELQARPTPQMRGERTAGMPGSAGPDRGTGRVLKRRTQANA